MWSQAPLIRLILPFIAGIAAAIDFPCRQGYITVFIALLVFCIAAVVLVPGLNLAYRRSWWFGLLQNAVMFLLAFQLTVLKSGKYDPLHFSTYAGSTITVLAKLDESSIEKEKTVKAVLAVIAVKQGKQWIPVTGRAMAYIRKDRQALDLKYGDELIFHGAFGKIAGRQNPGEFDYRRFLAFHSIYSQVSIGTNSWVPLHINAGNSLLRASYALRDRLLELLGSMQVKDDEFAVGAALLLGYCDKLDAETLSDYAGTGALHVLSVSGLHVAIVYFVFNMLLFFLDKIKYGRIVKAVLLILLLWFYAALTGLSPSVLRAATMFSFIITAKAFSRHTNIYNTLAASAFVLLVINPYIIMEVGFQLSYLAVIGIVSLQPGIHSLLQPQGWLSGKIWSLCTVSLAAQISTFPLGLYYFHQFPNYFLVSGFIVIPLSTIIIYMGIALFLFSKIPFIAHYLAFVFRSCVWLMNASVRWIGRWPGALTDGISISFTEMLLLYTVLILLILYLFRPRFSCLLYAGAAAVLFLFLQAEEQHRQLRQCRMIVYAIPKTTAIDLVSGKSNVLLTDTAFAQDEQALKFHLENNWSSMGIDHTVRTTGNSCTGSVLIRNNVVCFAGKRILLVTGCLQPPAMKADYLVVSKNPQVTMEEMIRRYHPEQVIIDASNSPYRVKRWKDECRRLSQRCYPAGECGAFVQDL